MKYLLLITIIFSHLVFANSALTIGDNVGDSLSVENNELGMMYYNGIGVEQDFEKAEKYLRLAAEQGHLDAQINLAEIYHYGLPGVKQNFEKAIKYYKLAAAQGHLDAINSLGNMHRKGFGVEQDFEKAIEYFKLAADQGHLDAQEMLEILLDKSKESKNPKKETKKIKCENNFRS